MDAAQIWLMIGAGIVIATLVTSGRGASRTVRRARRTRERETRSEFPLA